MENTEYIIQSDRDKILAFNSITDCSEDGTWEVSIHKIVKSRTTRQNAALFKYYRLMATALQEAGFSLRSFTAALREGFEITVTMEAVRAVAENVSQDMFKKPVKDLSTTEIQKLYETVNLGFGQSMGVSLPWPSSEAPPFGE